MHLDADAERRLARIGWRAAALPDDAPPDASVARVVAQHRAGYEIHDGAAAFNAQPAPRFLKRGIDPIERPAVGDFVLIVPGAPPQIERVLPRRTMLSRAAAGERHERQLIAANVDSVIVMNGLDGDLNAARIERYLVLIGESGATPVVVLTKADRAEGVDAAIAALRVRVPAHAEILAINAKSPESIAPLL